MEMPGKTAVEIHDYLLCPPLSFSSLPHPPQLLRRRFSALEHGIQPPPAQSKIEELEGELETEMGQETEPDPDPEPEPEPEPKPRQL